MGGVSVSGVGGTITNAGYVGLVEPSVRTVFIIYIIPICI